MTNEPTAQPEPEVTDMAQRAIININGGLIPCSEELDRIRTPDGAVFETTTTINVTGGST